MDAMVGWTVYTGAIQKRNIMREATQLRVHEVSDSANYRHYSCCHCLVAEPKKYLGTLLLFWLALALYAVAAAPLTSLPLILVTALLALAVQLLLIALAFADPGNLPKILPSYERADLGGIPLAQSYYSQEMRNVQAAYCFATGAHSLRVKFCNSCYVFRPARTSHCYDCNSCVERFDHHCPWIGICVGKRNYCLFLAFLLLLAALAALLLVQAVLAAARAHPEHPLHWLVLSILLALYALAATAFVSVLLAFHLNLIRTNLTTNEFCKDSWAVLAGNPFAKTSCGKNLLKLFGKRPPELVDPEAEVVVREVRRSEGLGVSGSEEPAMSMENIVRVP